MDNESACEVVNTPLDERPHVVLISGVPATGKSTFGRWLSQNRGFCYFCLEKNINCPEWSAFCSNPTNEGAFGFTTKLGTYKRPYVVLDWGFPIQCIGMIKALKAVGVAIWWFNSDKELARKKFIERGNPKYVVNFDRQWESIKSIWPQIKALFSPNIIETISPSGEYIDQGELYSRIFLEMQSQPHNPYKDIVP